MTKHFFFLAALLGGLCIALGAFAAHRLRELIPSDSVAVFETGVRYQMYHVFALFIVGFAGERTPLHWFRWAGNCFVAGILLFSGSLYSISLLHIGDHPIPAWVGIITPIGGLLLITGWLLLIIGFARR